MRGKPQALLAALLLWSSAGGAGALDLRRAEDSFRRLSQELGATPGPEPPAPPEPGRGGGLHDMVLEYRIEAPMEDVWEFYTLTPLQRVLPSDWVEPTLRPHRIQCPDRTRTFDPERVWPELQPGLLIEGLLRWGPTRIRQDMEVSGVERLKRVEFRYGERAPAEGVQSIVFEAGSLPSGGPSVRVVHAARYRGKNALYQSMYRYVHRRLLDFWHLSAKRFLENRAWAGSFCAAKPPPQADGRLEGLLERIRRRVPGGGDASREGVAEALCLSSARSLAPSPPRITDEDGLADTVGALAVALERDRAEALRLFREQVEADAAARAASLRACR